MKSLVKTNVKHLSSFYQRNYSVPKIDQEAPLISLFCSSVLSHYSLFPSLSQISQKNKKRNIRVPRVEREKNHSALTTTLNYINICGRKRIKSNHIVSVFLTVTFIWKNVIKITPAHCHELYFIVQWYNSLLYFIQCRKIFQSGLFLLITTATWHKWISRVMRNSLHFCYHNSLRDI